MSRKSAGRTKRGRGSWRRVGVVASGVLALGFAVMWVAGRFTYTSVGMDHDVVNGDRVAAGYYRLRWPGDGSLWIGGGSHDRPLSAGPPERFDPAAAWFGRPNRPEPRSAWNRLGFWWVGSAADDPFLPAGASGTVRSGWVAVPGWLPVVLFGTWPVWRLVRRCRRRPGAASGSSAPDRHQQSIG